MHIGQRRLNVHITIFGFLFSKQHCALYSRISISLQIFQRQKMLMTDPRDYKLRPVNLTHLERQTEMPQMERKALHSALALY